MTKQIQALINRVNAQKSTGPRTTAGKQRSRMNAVTHNLSSNETDTDHDDRIEVMAAQTRSWIERSNSFDTLGRYEARLSRQLLKYQEEFERLQTDRKKQEFAHRHRSAKETEEDRFDPASFGQVADSFRILTHLPVPCTAGDLVTGEVAA